MLQLIVNGKEANLPEGSTLADLVVQKKLNVATIIVEHNTRIVPQSEWPKILLRPEDAVEILSFVGGG